MQLTPWNTDLLNAERLYFCRLLDTGNAYYEVEDEAGQRYEITVDNDVNLYVLVDEEFLARYSNMSVKGLGVSHTFEVLNSGLKEWYFSGSHLPKEEYRHFVVMTCDACLEIISKSEPVIRSVDS
ncbi:hypothetical protein [uncultured Pseudoteredinibacter sp.]|uniref:hypothetical protein n=1 Tax=uncultured Pseudoteredinibacter sp. TaxID=1641701 RepID=UPI002617DD97|nr:hypothetical protein [uncultured Pseudoteredinibacter sp.]